MLRFKKCELTDHEKLPLSLNNFGDVKLLEDTITNCIKVNADTDKLQLGREIASALLRTQRFDAKALTINPVQTEQNKDRIVLDVVDHWGNVEHLSIFIEDGPEEVQSETLEVPECSIKNFYIGSDYGSGIKAKSLKEFLEYIIEEAVQAGYDGKETFDITLAE